MNRIRQTAEGSTLYSYHQLRQSCTEISEQHVYYMLFFSTERRTFLSQRLRRTFLSQGLRDNFHRWQIYEYEPTAPHRPSPPHASTFRCPTTSLFSIKSFKFVESENYVTTWGLVAISFPFPFLLPLSFLKVYNHILLLAF